MKPEKFNGFNIEMGSGQDEFNNLPAKLDRRRGTVVTCWKATFIERLVFLFTGRIWFRQLTFNRPMQAVNVGVYRPEIDPGHYNDPDSRDPLDPGGNSGGGNKPAPDPEPADDPVFGGVIDPDKQFKPETLN